MPCRSHCAQQRQGGGIHRHAAETVLHSLPASLPTGPSFASRELEESRSETQRLYPISWNRLLNFSRGFAPAPHGKLRAHVGIQNAVIRIIVLLAVARPSPYAGSAWRSRCRELRTPTRLKNFQTEAVTHTSVPGLRTYLGQTVNIKTAGRQCVRYATLELYLIEDIFRPLCSGVFSRWPGAGEVVAPIPITWGLGNRGLAPQREVRLFTQ
jgi:hypothetical protein